MTRKEFKEDYYEFSGYVSSLTERLDFAGIAIIWIFRMGGEKSVGISFDSCMVTALIFFVFSLGIHFLQYSYQACATGIYNNLKKNQGIAEDDELTWPSWMNWTPICFIVVKAILMFVGFIILIGYLWPHITV